MGVTCNLKVEEKSYSISNNTSQVYVKLTATTTGSSYNNTGPSGSITIDGTKYNFSKNIPLNSTTTLYESTKTITHNSDGKKTITVSYTFNTEISAGVLTGSRKVTLTTIPRTSTVTCADGNIGSATTININRASSSFTHTITYSFSGLTGTIATKTSNTSIGWTIPTSFYEKVPNAKSGKVTINCDTYSGSTKVGSSSTTANVFVINSEPDVEATIKDVNSATVALTGDSNKFVKYMSNAKVEITATAKNSATIKSKKVICGNKSGTSTSNTLNNVESGTFVVSCTDSRGFSASKTITKTLVNYIKLAFTDVSLERPSTTSNTVNASLKGNWFNDNFGTTNNTLSMKYRYRQSGGSWGSYNTISPNKNGNTFSYSSSLGSSFNFNYEYEFEFVIEDKLMTVTQDVIVTQGIPILDIGKGDVVVNGELYIGDLNVEKAIEVNNVTSSADLDDYTETGIWSFNSTINGPNDTDGGWLRVMRTSQYAIKQIFYNLGMADIDDWYIFVRTKAGSSWSRWQKIQLEGEVLYENSSGTAGTVTLSESSYLYKYLEIFFKNNDDMVSSIRVDNPNGKDVLLVSTTPNYDGNTYLKSTMYSISGTKMTPEQFSQVTFFADKTLSVNTSENRISIVKVLGYI